MAHLEVSAGSGRVLSGSIRAADLLNLLTKALQGGVHLQVAVTENISIISTEHAVGIRGFLLGNETNFKSTTRGTGRSWGSRRSRRTLREKEDLVSPFLASYTFEKKDEGKRQVKEGLAGLTAGPISPLRPRGPGGPVGPGRPDMPSLPGEPADPAGPCKKRETISNLKITNVCKVTVIRV